MTLKAKCWDQLGKQLKMKSGRLLGEPGMVPSCCYYIQKGKVILYAENDSGLKQAYGLMREGSLILAQDLIRGEESRLYYETVGAVQVREITRFQLMRAWEQEPEVSFDILDTVMEFTNRMLDNRLNEWKGNAASRLCSLILELAESYGVKEDSDTVIHQKLSQELMGQLTGLHRITVVREIKKMQEKRLIYRKMPWYVIPDMGGLVEYRNQQCG